MSGTTASGESRAPAPRTPGRGLRLSGGLLLSGFVVNTVSTLIHPSGEEDDHEAIFTEYADSGAWEAVHIGQFIGGLLVVAGLLALHRILRVEGEPIFLARLAAAAAIATAGALAVLQGLDGVALKQAVDAWVEASGPAQADAFSNAETVRWLEWGFQSYFRILLGLSFALSGAAILATRLAAGWIGWAGVLAGVFAATIGVAVGYSGLDSDFQGIVGMAFLIAVLTFAFGLFAAGGRPADRRLLAPS